MTNMQETLDRMVRAPETVSAACCGQEIPEECLDGLCQHGRPSMWNVEEKRWEIPQDGPCGEYRNAGERVLHTECPPIALREGSLRQAG